MTLLLLLLQQVLLQLENFPSSIAIYIYIGRLCCCCLRNLDDTYVRSVLIFTSSILLLADNILLCTMKPLSWHRTYTYFTPIGLYSQLGYLPHFYKVNIFINSVVYFLNSHHFCYYFSKNNLVKHNK